MKSIYILQLISVSCLVLVPNGFAQDGVYSLYAKVVVAYEDGPIVVRLTLTYSGKSPATIRRSAFGDVLFDLDGKRWRPVEKMRATGGPYYWPETISEDSKIVVDYCVSANFTEIKAGMYDLHFAWPVVQSDNKKIVARPSARIKVDIKGRKKIDAEELRRIVAQECSGKNVNATRVQEVARWFENMKLPAALPALYSLMGTSNLRFSDRKRVLWRAWAIPNSLHDVNFGIVAQLSKKLSPEGAPLLLLGIRAEPRELRPNDWELLRNAKDPLVRALYWVYFPEKTPEHSLPDLLRSLEKLKTPLVSELFDTKLKLLDSPKFQERTSALAWILSKGEVALPALRKAVATTASTEVAERSKRLIDQIESSWPLRFEADVLLALSDVDSPESLAVVRAISKNMPESQLTKHATVLLRKFEHKSYPPRKE